DEALENYLRNKDDRMRVIARSRSGMFPDLTSPMQLLMVVRLANEVEDWPSLSLFSLYERYLGVLHRFFNSSTVRGGAAATPEIAVLDCLSNAAFEVRTGLWRRELL